MLDPVFILAVLPVESYCCGITSKTEVEKWRAGTSRAVVIENPVRLIPKIEQNGVHISLGPLLLGNTAQKEVYVVPNALEVIGEVTGDSCSASQGLFNAYEDAVQQKRAAQSGLTIPSGDQLSAALRDPKARGNVTPFNPRRS